MIGEIAFYLSLWPLEYPDYLLVVFINILENIVRIPRELPKNDRVAVVVYTHYYVEFKSAFQCNNRIQAIVQTVFHFGISLRIHCIFKIPSQLFLLIEISSSDIQHEEGSIGVFISVDAHVCH